MAVHPHAVRSCVYDEAEACKQAKLDDPSRIDAQMSRYRQAGYPAGAGLWENSVVVRRLADSRVIQLNEAWWNEITRGSVRDQLSLPVVVHEVGLDVQPLRGTVYDGPFASMARGPMSVASSGRAEPPPPRGWRPFVPFTRPQSRLFHDLFYRATNTDVTHSTSPAWRSRGSNPIDHYLTVGWREDRDPHPLFDVSFYLEANPDVARAGVEPLTHYLEVGAREGRDPHVLFDTAWYLGEYGDACRHAAGGALGHYLWHGWRAGAQPNRWFSPADYGRRYPDVAASRMEPLEHYLRYGINEGRDPRDGGGVMRPA